MKSVHIVKVICVMLFALFLQKIQAQVGITAVPFLQINNDARSSALADADVAKISRNGLHLNPAALGPVNNIQLSTPFNTENSAFFSTDWLKGFNGNDLWFASPKFVVGLDKLVIGYQYNRLNLGEQSITEERTPAVTGTYDSYEVSHGFSFSYPLTKFVSVGAGVNFIKSDLSSRTTVGEYQVKAATQVALDLGVYAQRPIEYEQITVTPSLGWSLTDFGKPISYTSAPYSEDALPIMMRGGLGLTIDLKKYVGEFRILSFSGYGALSKIMARYEEVVVQVEGGEDYIRYEPVGPFEAVFTSWDTYTQFNGQDYIELKVGEQFMRHAAFEATFLEILSFRFGHYYEDENNGDREFDTFGIGVQYAYFALDYAEYRVPENEHPLEGTKFYQFSINIPLEVVSGFIKK